MSKILIIEDEVSQRKVLRDKFTNEHFIVEQATNGEEGLEVALRERPHIILLDLIMPKMDGLTMMKKLRQESLWGKTVPIIILTNLSADNDTINRSVDENEPAYYLVKSNWTMEDILAKVKERLARVS